MAEERLEHAHRRAQIVATATELSRNGGLYTWNLSTIADKIDVSTPLIKYYMGEREGFRNEIIVKAIKERDLDIIMQALAKHDPVVKDIDDALKQAAARYLGNVA